MKIQHTTKRRIKSEKDIERLIKQFGGIDVTTELGEVVNLVDFLHLYDGQNIMVEFENEKDYDCLSHVFSI